MLPNDFLNPLCVYLIILATLPKGLGNIDDVFTEWWQFFVAIIIVNSRVLCFVWLGPFHNEKPICFTTYYFLSFFLFWARVSVAGFGFFFKVVIDVARYKLLRWNFENLFFVYFLSPIIYHLLVFVLFLSFFLSSLRTKKYITLKFQNAQPMWKFLYNGREQWMKQKSKKSWPIFHLFCLFVCLLQCGAAKNLFVLIF